MLCPLCAAKPLGHGAKRLVQFIHLRWLEQIPAHAETDGLLCVGKITVAGQHSDLHSRKLALEPGKHCQPVLIGHADIGKDDIRPCASDHSRAGSGVIRRPNNLTMIFRPFNDPAEALDDDPLVVDQHDPVHTLILSQFRRIACSTASRAEMRPVTMFGMLENRLLLASPESASCTAPTYFVTAAFICAAER